LNTGSWELQHEEFALSQSGSIWKSLMLQEGAYTMDQEFDGKGLTPYDPAHNSSFLLAGHNLQHGVLEIKNLNGTHLLQENTAISIH
jgi:hypothetical protein